LKKNEINIKDGEYFICPLKKIKKKVKKGKEKKKNKQCLYAHLEGFQTQLVDDFHEPKM